MWTHRAFYLIYIYFLALYTKNVLKQWLTQLVCCLGEYLMVLECVCVCEAAFVKALPLPTFAHFWILLYFYEDTDLLWIMAHLSWVAIKSAIILKSSTWLFSLSCNGLWSYTRGSWAHLWRCWLDEVFPCVPRDKIREEQRAFGRHRENKCLIHSETEAESPQKPSHPDMQLL